MPVPKVTVQCLEHDGSYTTHIKSKYSKSYWPNFRVRFTEESQLEPLRYAIDELIAEKPVYESMFDTEWFVWKVSDSFFSAFKDWLILPDELANMRQQSLEAYEKQKKEKLEQAWKVNEKRKEDIKRYLIECRHKRIPCTGPCKVPVKKITCLREEPMSVLGEERYYFAVELDQGTTKQQKLARLYLAKTLAADHSTGIYYHTDNIKGRGCNWTIHEFVLLAYSEWLELDEPIETIIAFAVQGWEEEMLRKSREEAKEREKRQREHEHWWKEHRDQWQIRSSLPKDAISASLMILNLDRTATLETVKKQYRALAKQYHPDTGGDEAKFKELNKANQVLMQHFP